MFHLIIFACFLHLSVGCSISGQVLLDGDKNKSDRISPGSNLVINLQDTRLADAPAINLAEVKYSDLSAFPYSYEIEIPDDLPPSSYTLQARITNGQKLLYINDQYVPVPTGDDSSIIKDIPVIRINHDSTEDTKTSWPEMLGKEGTYAVEYIKEKSGLTNVFTLLETAPMTMDYSTDRVRVIVNKKDIVTVVPSIG
ncbi:unnamed protein product [Adineta steineri]|uniref:Uncharacterized protein n=1 Tax=Adineta steineri TaxID=433720 RepID=A0A814I3N2_9BILA|nr:unnamed protein product [Adineta steineri]CAF3611048.1 unnamed protein product [Adineta steineri]